MKKLIALVLALAMVATLGLAFAANTAAEPTGDYSSFKTTNGATITISNANKGQKYDFYQIFEAIPNTTSGTATSVSYKMIGSASMPTNDYFEVDNGGNVVMKGVENPSTHVVTYAAKGSDDKLTAGAISWLNSVKASIGRKVAEVTASDDGAQVMQNLPFGYYFISTTTGTVVTVDSTMPTASVTDKNPTTTIDKSITGVDAGYGSYTADDAIAQIGKVVSFKAEIEIKNGAYNYVFKDQMSHGLTLGTVTVKLRTAAGVTSAALDQDDFATSMTATNVEADTTAQAENNDIEIAFKDTWLAANVGSFIVIEYTGTVNATAVVADGANPNKAIIEYGNTAHPLTHEDIVRVYSAKVKIIKEDGTGAALEGAGFVLAKDVTANGTTTRYYYVRAAETDTVTWTTNIESATVKTSAIASGETQATAEFKGLADGTYTLIEKVVPPGYNKAADKTVTIKPVTDNNLTTNNLGTELTATSTVINNSGTELPSTGGIGTTIFYIVGGLLVIGAAVILVARRKAHE